MQRVNETSVLGPGHIQAFHPEGMWESCWEAGFTLGSGAWRVLEPRLKSALWAPGTRGLPVLGGP